MGNLVSSSASVVATGGKVVLSDGSVRALSEPVSVAELMMEHPRHFVVDARLVTSGGAKVAPLPADHMLDAGGVYVMLPATRRKVSVDEARRALVASRSLARSRSMPARMRKSASSAGRGGEMDADGSKHEAAAAEETVRLDGFEDHRPEFLSRELSCRGWKPSLRTIQERVVPKKVPHWLF